MSRSSSLDLPIESFRAGGRQAFEVIFLHYQDRLLYFALKTVKSPEVAKDIVQETFIRLWLHRQTVKEATLEAYLFTIVRNLAVDYLKNLARQTTIGQEYQQRVGYSQNTTERHLLDNEYQQHLQAAINRLPRQRKKVFCLTRDEGLTHEAVAAQLGISRETVKRQVSFALQDIRAYLKQHADIAISLLITFLSKLF